MACLSNLWIFQGIKDILFVFTLKLYLFYLLRLGVQSIWNWFLYMVKSRGQETFFLYGYAIDPSLLTEKTILSALHWSVAFVINQVTGHIYFVYKLVLFHFQDSYNATLL